VGHVWVEDGGGAGNILWAPEADGDFLPAQKGKWRLEEELCRVRVMAGFRGVAAQQVKAGVEGSGPRVEVDALLMFEHPDTRVDVNVYANNGCWLRCAILCKDTAAFDGDFVGDMEVYGNAVPGGCGLGLRTMPLDGLDTRRDGLREASKRVAGGDAALRDAAGDNGANSLKRERAVDGQPCGEQRIWIWEGYDGIHKCCAELVHSLPSDGADGEHFCSGKGCCGEAFADVILYEGK